MTTVFFGPFIGEFAWELIHWQGWVREITREKYSKSRVIVSSYNGRAGLYPDADEFWPLPQWFTDRKINSVRYILKGWKQGLPGSKEIRVFSEKKIKDGRLEISSRTKEVYIPADHDDTEPVAEKLLAEFQSRLPDETVLHIPWRYNVIEEQKLEFGVLPADHPLMNLKHPLPKEKRIIVREIPLAKQARDTLGSTREAREILDKILEPKIRLISIFPRYREHYKSRNWPRENYEILIDHLKKIFPHHRIAILGEPGSSHFDDEVPIDTLDLINMDPANRVAVQIAALERSILSIGSSSGALLLPHLVGCPIIRWSHPDDISDDLQYRNDINQYIRETPQKIIPNMQPDIAEVLDTLDKFKAELIE